MKRRLARTFPGCVPVRNAETGGVLGHAVQVTQQWSFSTWRGYNLSRSIREMPAAAAAVVVSPSAEVRGVAMVLPALMPDMFARPLSAVGVAERERGKGSELPLWL